MDHSVRMTVENFAKLFLTIHMNRHHLQVFFMFKCGWWSCFKR